MFSYLNIKHTEHMQQVEHGYAGGRVVTWKLKEALDSRGITRYRLSKESGVSMNTVRELYDGKTERPDLRVLNQILNALNRLTDTTWKVGDLLEHVEDAE